MSIARDHGSETPATISVTCFDVLTAWQQCCAEDGGGHQEHPRKVSPPPASRSHKGRHRAPSSKSQHHKGDNVDK